MDYYNNRPYPNPASALPTIILPHRVSIKYYADPSASRKRGTIPPASHLLTFHLNDPVPFYDGTHFDKATEVVYWNKIYRSISTTLIRTYSARFLQTCNLQPKEPETHIEIEVQKKTKRTKN